VLGRRLIPELQEGRQVIHTSSSQVYQQNRRTRGGVSTLTRCRHRVWATGAKPASRVLASFNNLISSREFSP
jgi:hypothetical protein